MKLLHRSSQRAGPTSSHYLIVGLGNPGREYQDNRHNIGFMCLDALARQAGVAVQRKRLKALMDEAHLAQQPVILAKPQTFMNASGESVARIAHWYHLPPERLLVIHDDLDLPFGRIRVRPGGGSGGHNGLKSVIAELGSSDFCRLRIGIGRPLQGDPIDYVLNDFAPDQEAQLPRLVAQVGEIVRYWLERGVREAMNAYNGQDLPPSD